MLDSTLFVIVVGKLISFLIMNLPPAKKLATLRYDGKLVGYFGELFACDLCFNVWIYFILCCFFKVALGPYVPLVSESITAAIFSFVVHLISLGWKVKWGVWN